MTLQHVRDLMKLENERFLEVERAEQMPMFRNRSSSAFHAAMCDAWDDYLTELIELNEKMYGDQASEDQIRAGLTAENEVIAEVLDVLTRALDDEELEDLEYAHLDTLKRVLELDRDGNELLLEMLVAPS